MTEAAAAMAMMRLVSRPTSSDLEAALSPAGVASDTAEAGVVVVTFVLAVVVVVDDDDDDVLDTVGTVVVFEIAIQVQGSGPRHTPGVPST